MVVSYNKLNDEIIASIRKRRDTKFHQNRFIDRKVHAQSYTI